VDVAGLAIEGEKVRGYRFAPAGESLSGRENAFLQAAGQPGHGVNGGREIESERQEEGLLPHRQGGHRVFPQAVENGFAFFKPVGGDGTVFKEEIDLFYPRQDIHRLPGEFDAQGEEGLQQTDNLEE